MNGVFGTQGLPGQPGVSGFNGTIEKSVICRAPAYQDMFNRPYHSVLSQNLGVVREASGGMDFSAARLAPLTATMMLPVTQPESQAMISNGWNIERCLFSIKIVLSTNHDSSVRYVQYLMGYTDHMGLHPSLNGGVAIDDNMMLYFNSNLMYQEHRFTNGNGMPVVQITPCETTQLLTGLVGSAGGGNGTYTCRPEDVYSRINAQELLRANNRYDELNGIASQQQVMYDGRVGFQPGQPYKKSTKENLIPSQYLSRILSSASNPLNAQEFPGKQPHEMAASLSGRVTEGYMSNDTSLRYIQENTSMADNRAVTWGELRRIFPDLDARTVRSGMQGYGTGRVEGAVGGAGSEFFGGGSYGLLIAQTIANVGSAVMNELQMTSIKGAANNMCGHDHVRGLTAGQFVVDIFGADSFVDGRPIEQFCEMFKHRLISEYLCGFTGHNHVNIGFSFELSIYGESVVIMSYNNEPPVRFVLPMFCDSLFSPLITNNLSTLTSLATETRSITHNLLGVL